MTSDFGEQPPRKNQSTSILTLSLQDKERYIFLRKATQTVAFCYGSWNCLIKIRNMVLPLFTWHIQVCSIPKAG